MYGWLADRAVAAAVAAAGAAAGDAAGAAAGAGRVSVQLERRLAFLVSNAGLPVVGQTIERRRRAALLRYCPG